MKRILIIGGYGGFGARLSRRLAADGHHVMIAGRNGTKAAEFAANLARAEGAVVDRNGDIAAALATLRPDIVIDAAGPFQGSDYRVPLACIDKGVHYLDLADARDFVCGIGELDEAAKDAGVAIIAGASTLPALSSAVVRHLTHDFEQVDRVEMALSAFNKSTVGESVARAILSYAGQPIRLWRNKQWMSATGWQEMRSMDFVVGERSVRGRWVALSDVPDLELMPDSLPGQPEVVFRAGNELKLQMAALWAMSWLVRWGLVKSLSGAARWLMPLQRAMLWMGSDRSAMQIAATGWREGRPMERRWTIVAGSGDGPEMPTLAAQLLVRDLAAGQVEPGAYPAMNGLNLSRFDPLIAPLDIHYAVTEHPVEIPVSRTAYRAQT